MYQTGRKRRETSRLLSIGGEPYRLRRIACDPSIGATAFQLDGPRGTYHLVQTPHGPECDCWDFLVRRDGLDPAGCKHVKALVAERLMAAADVRER